MKKLLLTFIKINSVFGAFIIGLNIGTMIMTGSIMACPVTVIILTITHICVGLKVIKDFE